MAPGCDPFFRQAGLTARIIVAVWMLSLGGATWNHVSDLVRYGLFPYAALDANVPAWLNAFWTLLTVFDPLAIVVLLFRVRAGARLCLAIIAGDVVINWTFFGLTYGPERWLDSHLACQFAFLCFVLLTLRPVLRQARYAAARAR